MKRFSKGLFVILLVCAVLVTSVGLPIRTLAEGETLPAQEETGKRLVTGKGSITVDGIADSAMLHDLLLADGIRAGILWDDESGKIYIGVQSDTALTSVTVALHPVSVTADITNGMLTAGNATLGVAEDKTYAELAIPMENLLPAVTDDGILLKTALQAVSESGTGEIAGDILFVNLSDTYSVKPTFSGGAPFDSSLNAYVLTDDGSAEVYRRYNIQANNVTPLTLENQSYFISMNLKVVSLPVVEETQMEMYDSGAQADKAACLRIAALKWSDQAYDFNRNYGKGFLFQIYNLKDTGLVLFATDSQNKVLPVIPLGKQLNDAFRFSIIWTADNIATVFVDNEIVGTLENVSRARSISTTIGAYIIDIVRGIPMEEGESIRVEHSGHTVSIINDLDGEALLKKTAYVFPASVYMPMGEVVVDGKPDDVALLLDQEGSVGIRYGAAWSMTEKKVYLMLKLDGMEKIDLSVGFAQGTVDVAGQTIEGIEGASVCSVGSLTEIAIPIGRMSLTYADGYIATPFRFTVEGATAAAAEGTLYFTDSHIFVSHTADGSLHRSETELLKTSNFNGFEGSLTDENGIIRMIDSGASGSEISTSGRTYAIFYKIDDMVNCSGRNYAFNFDLCVNSMPVVSDWDTDKVATGAAENPARIAIFAARDLASNQVLILNIYNTAEGLVFVVNAPTTAYSNAEEKWESVPLGKNTGDRFRITLNWTETGDLTLSVDGEEIRTFTNVTETKAKVIDHGGFSFNTFRELPMAEGETIDVEYGNIVLTYTEAFDIRALAALSTTEVTLPDDIPGGDEPGGDEPGGEEPGGDETGGNEIGGDETGGDQPGDSTTDSDQTSDTTGDPEEPKPGKGCSSTVSGIGVFCLFGAAVAGALFGRRKKQD